MEDVRTGINLRGYAQKDPLVEYKNEAFGQFERLIKSIDDGIVNRFFKVNIVTESHVHNHVHREASVSTNQPAEEIGLNAKQKEIEKVKKVKEEKKMSEAKSASGGKLGRNDPCPCGSGKKWKRCHYPN